MELRKASPRPASFTDHLRRALEALDQPAQLGAQSPLAAPYVLGEALRGVEATPLGRGLALRELIRRAAEQLWGGPLPADGQAMLGAALAESDLGGRYDCLVLELNYFRQRYRPAPRSQAEIYSDILHISRPTHDRHLRRAVERLGAALLALLRPAIHLERPAPPPALVGRAALLERLGADLRAGRSVALSGPGGVGKTALGAAAADAWAPRPRFWYTFRPALGEQLEGLLFALGRFLHAQGAPALWHQLVAERGRVPDGALALGLALADLRELPEPPLLCFDELDILRPAAGEARPGHTQILAFLEGLRGHAPLLLIGQRAFWAGDAIYEVGELSRGQLAEWLAAVAIPHAPADVSHLHDYTAGNPRLAELCVALFQTGAGASFAAALEQLPRAQALLPLWLRLERGLPAAERRLLQALAVFRTPAPADAWLGGPAEQAEALRQLIARRLAQIDGRGGVALLPALRDVVYAELPAERREELHAQAAQIRAERGAYTAAAYHLQRAGQPEAAVELWHEQRDQEIEQGQAGAALAIFAQISPRRLAPRQAQLLLLLRAELHELAGEPASVVEAIAQSGWSREDQATPEAMLRLGRAIEAQGDADLAMQAFQSGLEAAASLLRQSTQLHVQRSLTSLRRREMPQAWREASLAHFHAVTMLGIVRDQSGDYAAARGHYLDALAVAEQAGYQAGVAQTHHYLAMLAGRRQDLAEALPHFAQAIDFYERVGDRVNREYVRGNLASAFIQAGRFAEALEPAEQAMRFFEAMGNSFRTAQNASNLAEAHAELGNLDEAERHARAVLGLEEPQSHPYALYTLGTVGLRRGDLAQAERSYDQSRRIAEINDDAYLLAFAWRALGEVARARGREDGAQAALAQAAELFRRLGIAEELRRTEALAAQADANRRANDA